MTPPRCPAGVEAPEVSPARLNPAWESWNCLGIMELSGLEGLLKMELKEPGNATELSGLGVVLKMELKAWECHGILEPSGLEGILKVELKDGKLRLHKWKEFPPGRGWDGIPGGAGAASSLEVPEARLGSWKVSWNEILQSWNGKRPQKGNFPHPRLLRASSRNTSRASSRWNSRLWAGKARG